MKKDHTGKRMDEDAPANSAGAGNVAALGVGLKGEPGRSAKMMPMMRRGKFAGNPTFIVSSATFNSLKEAKKHKKHWRLYLGEDDAYHDLREYAKKCNGPIIVEDERTGACMFVRYGKGKLFEAHENKIRKSEKWLAPAGKNARQLRKDVVNNYGKVVELGKFKGKNVFKTSYGRSDAAYHLEDPETNKISHSVNGTQRNGVLTVGGAASTGKSDIKMHDFYHYLIKNHVKALVGTNHSPGAKKVWQRLAKKRGVDLHGWHKNKEVNLDSQDEMETHGNSNSSDPSERQVAATKLVASVKGRT